MNIIAEFDDTDVGGKLTKQKTLEVRRAARAIVFDAQGRIALIEDRKDGHHKIPGGGVEFGEDLKAALLREVREEAGCKVKVTGELGATIEYRGKGKMLQISYCYLAKVVGKKGTPAFTEFEKSNGFSLAWVPLARAVALANKDKPVNYWGRHMWIRDLAFLKAAQKKMQP